MNRFSFLLFTILMFCGINANAQNDDIKKDIPLHIEASLEAGTPCHKTIPFGANIDLSYSIKRFSLHIVTNTDYHIQKDGMSNNYNKATNLGGGIGYMFLPYGDNKSGGFEARAIVTTSLKSYDFKNTSYKIGINWIGSSDKRKVVPVVGIGFKFTDYSTNLQSYKGGYFSFGIRF